MGSCIGACVAQLACCCVSESAKSFSKTVGTDITTKLSYSIILLLVAIVGYILENIPDWTDNNSWITWLISFQDCPENQCLGAMATYRVTSAATVFHFILAVLLIGVKEKSEPRALIQDSWWALKLLILTGITVGFFFIPNKPFIFYGYASLSGSFIFIILQLILLVDVAHRISENWVGNYEETHHRIWVFALIGTSVLLYVASLVGTVLMYVYYCENERICWMNTIYITLNLIFAILYSLLSIFPKVQEKNPKSGLLQSAVVTSYCTYLVYSSIVSEPIDMGCSSLPITESGSFITVIVGVIITFFAIIYSALRTSSSNISEKSSLLSKEKPKIVEEGSETEDDEEVKIIPVPPEEVTYSYSFFHITFCMASQYLCMVLTNWAAISETNLHQLSVDQGMAAVWIKIVSSWLTIALYVWTIIAPLIFPNRIFV